MKNLSIFKSHHNSTNNGSFSKDFFAFIFPVTSTSVPNLIGETHLLILAWNDPPETSIAKLQMTY